MLFKNKNCSKCGSSYDIVNDTCPVCGAHNEEYEIRRVPKHHVWLPIYKQLIIFALGIILLNIISEIFVLTLKSQFVDNEIGFVALVNSIRYTVVAALIAVTLIGDFSKFKKSFTDWLPYVVGFCSGFLLIGVNIAYSNIVNLFYTTTTNDNQSLANSMVATYPLLSFFILCFVGPAVEEFTYRVGLFSLLTRLHKVAAYIITVAIFAFIHFDFGATGDALINELIHLPIYAISGAALCVLYDFMGLSSSLTAHTVNNILSILPVLLLKQVQ